MDPESEAGTLVQYEGVIIGLIDAAYAAAEKSGGWEEFLRRYSRAVNASCSALFVQRHDLSTANFEASVGMDGGFIQAYEAYYASINPLMILNLGRSREGLALPSQATISDAAFERTEFYADFMAPQDLHHELGCVLLKDEHSSAHLTAVRPKRAGAFADEELRILKTLLPHVQRALRLHALTSQLIASADERAEMLDVLDSAVLALDASGNVLFANLPARALMSRREIWLDRRQLRFDSSEANIAFQRETAGVHCEDLASGHRTFSVRTASGTLLRVAVSRLTRGHQLAPTAARTVVIIDVRQSAAHLTHEVARSAGLTPGERRVVELITTGSTTADIADKLSISIHTVRAHIKSALFKTGAHSQADLIRIIAGI